VTTPKAVLLPVLIVLALLAAGCEDNIKVTSPTTIAATETETHNTQVWPGGFSSRTFTMNGTGTVSVTLTTTTPADVSLGLVLGVPRSTGGCAPTFSTATRASATPQIVLTADPGTYCTLVYDLGTLTDPVSYTLKVEHPR